MRLIYSENEPIEKHPPRQEGEYIVIINKKTHLPCIGKIWGSEVLIEGENYFFIASPHYWEIAWP